MLVLMLALALLTDVSAECGGATVTVLFAMLGAVMLSFLPMAWSSVDVVSASRV